MKKQSITLTFILLLGAACTDSGTEPGPTDGGTVAGADAGPADTGPLAARYLVEHKGLFGDSPVNNRFLNPDFDLNAEGWLAYPTRDGATMLPTVQRRFVTQTPTRQPLLYMPKDANPFGVGIVGTARAGAGAFDVRVWIGRNVDDADGAIHASIIGVHPDEGERAWDLAPVEGSAIELGGRRWTQWSLRLDVGPVGFANLVIFDDEETPLFVTGPVMVPAAQMRIVGDLPAAVKVPGRDLRPREARAHAALRARFERSLGIRPEAPSLPKTAPRR